MPFSKRYFFDFLFRQHRQELLAFAGRHSNHEAAEDLVQEAYLRFIQQAETGHIENPRAYLYRITHNLSADYRSRAGGGARVSWPRATEEKGIPFRSGIGRFAAPIGRDGADVPDLAG
jgi:DNA-directed RNA polymerase specialized sigma24 family protein